MQRLDQVLDLGDEAIAEGRDVVQGLRSSTVVFGGRVVVWSQEGAGTEVELTIPASIAYRLSSARFKFSFLRKKKSEKHEQQI
jgi:hypothetical protein